MLVNCLRVTIYNQAGTEWWTEDIPQPTWGDIESAVRRLDGFCYPFIWFFRAEHPNSDELFDLSVIGGKGVYGVRGFLNERHFRYINPLGGEEIIPVWLSDQGFETESKYVCNNVETVLQATRYFYEQGDLDPALNWER